MTYKIIFFLLIFTKLFPQSIITPNSNKESIIDSNAITVTWKTLFPADTKIEYGLTNKFELGSISDPNLVSNHTIKIQNLKPATIYHLRCISKFQNIESEINNWIVCSASSTSSGRINVYFNHNINPKIANGEVASGDIEFVQILRNRIDLAKYSVDLCVYSFSGTPGAGDDLATALMNASARGVKVRFIIEEENKNTSPVNKIRNYGIPVITDYYGKNDGKSLQHNKFFIIDARDTVSDKDDWIITGSWNATNPGSYNDYQNIVEIQDKALAQAFTAEFNEMWGSDTDIPNPTESKFGINKTNNTPHRFNIKGVPVELYFSPSDGISSQIQNKINEANSSVFFSAMAFTSGDIANALKTRYTAKKIKIRGLINKDNLNDQGCQYPFFTESPLWADVKTYDPSNGAIFHHKYFIIDADRYDVDQLVMTGSYNFSKSAESENNENIIFIKDKRVANLYLQEFSQRYYEAGGKDSIRITSVKENMKDIKEINLLQNFPNPFNPSTVISFTVGVNNNSPVLKFASVQLKVYDILGREVTTLLNEEVHSGSYQVTFDGKNLTSGVYFYKLVVSGSNPLQIGIFTEMKKMVLMK